MVRGPRQGHEVGTRWVAVVAALVLAACDGTIESADEAASAGVSATTPEVLAGLGEALRAGQVQELVAVLGRASEQTAVAALEPGDRMKAIGRVFDREKNALLGRVGSLGVEPLSSWSQLPALHLLVKSEVGLRALAEAPEITQLERVRTFTTPEGITPAGTTSASPATLAPANLGLIKQPSVAAAGKLGAGTTVAVLDTGTDYKRAPFGCAAPGPACKVVYAGDFASEDNMPDDARAHGTNVAGTVLAVAPGAQIAALDVFDGNNASTTTILAAINWAIANRSKYNIVALNMSFGGGAFASACTSDSLALAIATARTSGIVSIVASGNEAKSSSLASPACSSKAVSVGAVYDTALAKLQSSVCTDNNVVPDDVACFSNSASFLTLLAPGVGINAAGLTMSGTSQAAPHVAGAVAVLRAAFPSESFDATVARLTASGVIVKDTRNGVARPRLNLEAAVAAGGPPAPAPAPAPSVPATPKPGPTGTISLSGGARTTSSKVIAVAVPTTSGTAAQICVSTSTSCSAWKTYSRSLIYTLPPGEGSKTLRAWWKDAAGNVSAKPATATILLDMTAPAGGKLSLKLANGTAIYSWTGVADYGSGIASYKLVTRNDAAVPPGCGLGTTVFSGGPSAKTANQTVQAGKLYYARLCAVDGAGNISVGIGGQFETPLPITPTSKR